MPVRTAQVGAAEWSAFLLQGLQREAVVISAGARIVPTLGREVHVPVLGASTPGWYSELQQIGEDAAEPREIVMVPKKCAVLQVVSAEAAGDAVVDVLDGLGNDLVRRLALEVDRALVAGTGGLQPTGLLSAGLPTAVAASINYAAIATAAGTVRGAGGRPDVALVNPQDHTSLVTATDAESRPLFATDAGAAPYQTLAGLRVGVTPAIPAGQAIVGQADQVLVAVRQDAEIAFDASAAFSRHGVMVRAVARVDVAPADTAAFVRVTTTA